MHMYLCGVGLMSVLRLGKFYNHHEIAVMDPDQWDQYLEGEPLPRFTVSIQSLTRYMFPQRVMDVMVPEGKAFATNGVVSHNTVIGVAASVSERTRTLIVASKIDFLRQFGKRFGELTNIRELYRRGRAPVVLIDPKGWADGHRYGVTVLKKWKPSVHKADVVLSTYQQFMDTEGGDRRFREYVLGKFGLIEADETHQAAARLFSRLMNRCDSRRKLGLTATIQRKDGLSPVVEMVLGKVVAKGNSVSDLPTLELMETGIGGGRNYGNFNSAIKFLSTMEERNKIIVRQAFADLRAHKRNSVLITTTRREHIVQLVKLINANAAYCNDAKSENWSRELAIPYMGGKDTNHAINLANSGRCRVVVAMVSMSQFGLDVFRWTHVYVNVTPTSNPYNTYQLINRVCTPYPTEVEARIGPKPDSYARIFVDAIGLSVFCFAKVFKNKEFGLEVGLASNNYVGSPLWRADEQTLARMKSIATRPKYYDPADAGVKIELGRTKTGRKRRKSLWKPHKDGITSL